MRSNTIKLYGTWQATAAVPQIAFVDAVYALCEENYDAGGDTVVECLSPAEILAEFTTLEDVKRYCGLLVDQALDTRWGADNDPEVERAKRYKEADWG